MRCGYDTGMKAHSGSSICTVGVLGHLSPDSHRTPSFLLQLEGLFRHIPRTTQWSEEDTLAVVIRLLAGSRTSETTLLTKLSDRCIFGMAHNSARHGAVFRADDLLDTAPPRESERVEENWRRSTR